MNQYPPTNMQWCKEHDIHYNATIYHCGECFRQQQKDNAKFKASAESWKEGWYEGREIIGRLFWTVPNVRVLKDSSSPFFQQQYQRFVEIARELEEEDFFRELLHRPEFASFFEKDPFPSPLMTLLGDN